MQSLRHQRVGQAEHDGHVGVRTRHQHVGVEEVRRIVLERGDADELGPGSARRAQPVANGVLPAAARLNLTVLECEAAEGDDQLGVLRDHRPARRALPAPDHVRHDDLAAGVAVAVDREGEAAQQVHETVQQGGRVVQSTGARPTVGPGEDRLVSVVFAHAHQLTRDQLERAFPGDRDEGLRAASVSSLSRGLLQPAGADHRLVDARRVIDRVGERARDRRRIGVLGEGVDLDDALVGHLHLEGAPVRRVRDSTGSRFRHGLRLLQRRSGVQAGVYHARRIARTGGHDALRNLLRASAAASLGRSRRVQTDAGCVRADRARRPTGDRVRLGGGAPLPRGVLALERSRGFPGWCQPAHEEHPPGSRNHPDVAALQPPGPHCGARRHVGSCMSERARRLWIGRVGDDR